MQSKFVKIHEIIHFYLIILIEIKYIVQRKGRYFFFIDNIYQKLFSNSIYFFI